MLVRIARALTPLFRNGAGAHGIGKINGDLIYIIFMYEVSIARLIVYLTVILDIYNLKS